MHSILRPVGVAATKLIVDVAEADSKHKPAPRHIVFAPTLVEREST